MVENQANPESKRRTNSWFANLPDIPQNFITTPLYAETRRKTIRPSNQSKNERLSSVEANRRDWDALSKAQRDLITNDDVVPPFFNAPGPV